MSTQSTVDPAEVEKFGALADEWWSPTGPFAPLHRLNPTRLTYLKTTICRHFGRPVATREALGGLTILDIGCGGGLISEPLAAMGATVTGADASEANVAAARAHAVRRAITVDYRATTAEALAEAGESFDVVLALEIVEHVQDVAAFVAACAAMVRPDGLFVVSTLNRTAKAFLLGIVAAERVLRWLPPGTHDFRRFVKPDELSTHLRAAGLTVVDESGIVYQPVADRWVISADTGVNYMMAATRPRS